jgi:hypothetical protein
MPFQLSPGVNVSEIDLTTIVPAVGTTEGAYAGRFAWGPMDEVVSITNQNDLVRVFGKPDSDTYVDFFTCSNFLSYARNLRIVRTANTALNATSLAELDPVAANTSGIQIKNRDQYELEYIDMTTANVDHGLFAAKYPGALGNSLKVSFYHGANNALSGNSLLNYSDWTYAGEFDKVTGTSTWASARGSANDEIHIIVVDADGKLSGVAGTVIEKFPFLSVASDAKNDDGSSNYYVNVLNDRSEWIYAIQYPSDAEGWGEVSTSATNYGNVAVNASGVVYTFAGGASNAPTTGDRELAYDRFANPEEVDVSLLIAGNASPTLAGHLKEIAETRKDCVAFISPEFSDVVNKTGSAATTNAIEFRNSEGIGSSSYMVMDSGWKYQFDKFNNVYRWIPLNGDIAGLCVRTDFERDPWFSPAGFNRGQIRNVVKLAWNPTKGQRDDLYKNGINPVVTFPGEGVVLFGDKTLQAKPSAFDRINVRRLFIVLEKAIARAAKYSLFEFNDAFTRAQFVALVEPYLRDVQGRRGIFDFRVVCDESNNTPEVIDRNEFIGDIYIKPARSINFIQLNFIAVRTGVAFDEIVGRF